MAGTDNRTKRNINRRDDGRWYTDAQKANLLRLGQWSDYVAPRPATPARPVAPVAPARPVAPVAPVAPARPVYGPGLPPGIDAAQLLREKKQRDWEEFDTKTKEETRQNEAIAPANISTSTGVINRGVNLGSGRRHKMGRKVKVQRGCGPFRDFVQKQMDKMQSQVMGAKTMDRNAVSKLFGDGTRGGRKIKAGAGLGFYDGLKFW